ncbi:MAG TPA: DUF3300 domain-containing protein [Bryobacteraceae bacterium]|nr:DUF3300 domain-containing protein [Bryobacteraceae bacterium]
MKDRKAVWYGLGRQGLSILCAFLLILFPFGVPAFAQYDAPPTATPAPSQPPPAQMLTPDQLDDLVAPIALYPDPLLGQVLAASTYPLEIVEAEQWLQANRGLQGQQLAAAARQQNWDPSVQALVVFPDVLGRMASDVSWTTDLGNAFLAQQADVMTAVQTMRARAQAAGHLSSDPEQTVTTQTQNGQTAIEIVPASPNVIYVPVYNPAYIWGPPVWGYYPPLYYPAIGFGYGFGAGIFLGAFFGGWAGWGWGWGGWGGWGWGPSWFGHTLLTNAFFFNHYGYRGFYGGGLGRGGVWAHNSFHRMGVPYSSAALAGRFGGSYMTRSGAVVGQRGAAFGAGRSFQGNARSFGAGTNGGGWQRFGGNNAAPRANGFAGSRYNAAPANRAPSAGGGWSHFNGSNSSPAYRGGFGGATSRPAPSFNGGSRSFGGGSFGGGSRSFGGASRSFSGGSRSFGGGSFGGGSRSFGGGSHSFGGGGSHSFGGGGSHGGGGGHHR